jgi:hypothetical protein
MLRTLMRPARFIALAAGVAALALASGCTTYCEELADKICLCVFEGPTRDACKNRVSSQLKSGTYRPGSSDEAYCKARLDECTHDNFCYWLNTEAGKVACGLAYPSP